MRASPAAVGFALLALVGCAPQPTVAGWEPPEGVSDTGVRLVGADAEDSGSAEGAETDAVAEAGPTVDPAAIGIVGGRLRNDALPISARFAYLPGEPAFNERVDEILWEAITASGIEYAPQAHGLDSGLGDRGCVSGSTEWSAEEVLSRPETAPPGSSGTAVTCEVTGAYGDIVTVTMRVVTGAPGAVGSDTSHHLVADVAAGTVADAGDRWSPDAAAELWRAVVELLREHAGGLSTAPLADPDDVQLRLAAQALRAAAPRDAGSLSVTMPEGLSAPELIGLGVPATTSPLELEIDAESARSWGNELQRTMMDQTGAPFSGLSAATEIAYDCALIPCVALTYDDGPGEYTAQLLDTLAGRKALATFYVVGRMVSASPESVVRASSEGHEIGSHTTNHPDLTKISAEAARQQVQDTAALISGLTGRPVTTFRPPYGAVNASVLAAVGLPAVLWSLDTNDWRRPGTAALLERSVGGAQPGGIILFHDVHPDTVAVAGEVIDGLRARGLEPVTVTTLLGGTVPAGRISGR